MLLYLGGQTVYNHDEEKPVLYVGKISYMDGKVFEVVYSLFDGKDLVNVDGSEIGHLFDKQPKDMLRTMIYGDFCNMSMSEGLDEDYVIENKKKIATHLNKVKKDIASKKVFIKEFK